MPIRDPAGIAGTVMLPTLSIGPAIVSQAEGNGGGATLFAYAVLRTGDTRNPITARWVVTGSGTAPASPADFIGGAMPEGTLTLAAGQVNATISVAVLADSNVEPDENFLVTLTEATMAVAVTIPAAGGTILNDDIAPAVTFLPALGTAPVAAWGPYKMVSNSYAGPLFRLVRSTDGATMAVASTGDGQSPDISGVAAWLGGSTATVDIVYDQTGNGNHLTQTTATLRPLFDPANAIGGRCPITFGASHTVDGLAPTWLTMPAAMSTDQRSSTLLLVATTAGPNPNTALVGFGTGASDYGGAYTTTNTSGAKFGGFSALNAAGYQAGPQMMTAAPSIAMIQAGPAALKTRVDGTQTSFAASAAATHAGGRLGSASYQYASAGAMQLFGLVLYPATLTDADAASVEAACRTIHALPASYDRQVVYDGDSISAAYYGRLKLAGLAQRMGLAGDPAAYVIAVSGQTMATTHANRVNALARIRSGYARNVLHLLAGTNDIENGTSASAVWTNAMLPYIQAGAAAGYTVVVGTVIPRGWSSNAAGKDMERLSLNATIRANAGSTGYAVADYGAITDLTTGAANNPPTPGYFVDGIHPNRAGQDLMIAIGKAAIEAVL